MMALMLWTVCYGVPLVLIGVGLLWLMLGSWVTGVVLG